MLLGDEQEDSVPNRRIYINDPIKNETSKFLHNRITTGKYNVLTFLPIFLWEQFSKYANLFFLFIAIIQVFFRIQIKTLNCISNGLIYHQPTNSELLFPCLL